MYFFSFLVIHTYPHTPKGTKLYRLKERKKQQHISLLKFSQSFSVELHLFTITARSISISSDGGGCCQGVAATWALLQHPAPR